MRLQVQTTLVTIKTKTGGKIEVMFDPFNFDTHVVDIEAQRRWIKNSMENKEGFLYLREGEAEVLIDKSSIESIVMRKVTMAGKHNEERSQEEKDRSPD